MSVWKKQAPLEQLNAMLAESLCSHVAIQITRLGGDFIEGTMPVDARTRQPFGLLHGGASVVLAETLGSVAANLCCGESQYCVGLEVNANHLKTVRSGHVTGIARAIHLGKKTQVWEIRITDADGELVCISRLTTATLEKNDRD